MAIPRLWAIFLVGTMLPALAPHPAKLYAQTASSGQSSALSYDDLVAAEKRAAAEKEAAATKHGKKNNHPDATSAENPAPQHAASQPAATQAVATPTKAAPAPSEAEITAAAAVSPASAAPATEAQPAPTSVPAVAATETAAPPAASAAADGTVPSATTAEAAETADGAMPKVAPKMQRTLFGKMKPVKEKAPKLVPVTIVHGELTVDGLIAKAGLNFQIIDMRYFYIWVPGLGTAIVSNQPFPGSQIQENALDGTTMTVNVEGHRLQLACDRDMLGGKKPKPLSLFVSLDKNFDKASNYPEFGYGTVLKPPYSWPGTLADLHPNQKAPPLPPNLRQNTESIKTCHKNEDGTQGACRTVEVPLLLGKTS
jgi:hypothetical protein